MQDLFTLDGALEAYPVAGARQPGIECMTGSIKVGMRADLCVFDQGITRLASDQIYSAGCELTLMDGEGRPDARRTN
jgi:predicted amidohydrolase YtcJ